MMDQPLPPPQFVTFSVAQKTPDEKNVIVSCFYAERIPGANGGQPRTTHQLVGRIVLSVTSASHLAEAIQHALKSPPMKSVVVGS